MAATKYNQLTGQLKPGYKKVYKQLIQSVKINK